MHFEDKDEERQINEEDPVEKVKETLAYCFNNVTFAEGYVNAIVTLAAEELKTRRKRSKSYEVVLTLIHDLISEICQTKDARTYMIPCRNQAKPHQGRRSTATVFSGWPKVSDFNIKLGQEKLEEYIELWKKSDKWMTCVEFLGFESEESSNYFIYEVQFSNPTPVHPIPQATVSVYFAVEVSKIVPAPYDAPVQVTYVFEASNVIHIPGRIDFQESWIKDLMRGKVAFFKNVIY